MENYNVSVFTRWTGVQGDEASFNAFDARECLKDLHRQKLVWHSEWHFNAEIGMWHLAQQPNIRQAMALPWPVKNLNVQMTKPFWRPFRLLGRPGGLVQCYIRGHKGWSWSRPTWPNIR